jgi:hypothetical protein
MEDIFRICTTLNAQSDQEVTAHVIYIYIYVYIYIYIYICTSFYLNVMGPSDLCGHPHIWRRA